mmetsp:Transcript_22280/g.46162  ORF Transcript_22280/g.46162 Transcript_22280/m.46162 type:complete len:222 (+) Transcript_22280:728-1393(+)
MPSMPYCLRWRRMLRSLLRRTVRVWWNHPRPLPSLRQRPPNQPQAKLLLSLTKAASLGSSPSGRHAASTAAQPKARSSAGVPSSIIVQPLPPKPPLLTRVRPWLVRSSRTGGRHVRRRLKYDRAVLLMRNPCSNRPAWMVPPPAVPSTHDPPSAYRCAFPSLADPNPRLSRLPLDLTVLATLPSTPPPACIWGIDPRGGTSTQPSGRRRGLPTVPITALAS